MLSLTAGQYSPHELDGGWIIAGKHRTFLPFSSSPYLVSGLKEAEEAMGIGPPAQFALMLGLIAAQRLSEGALVLYLRTFLQGIAFISAFHPPNQGS